MRKLKLAIIAAVVVATLLAGSATLMLFRSSTAAPAPSMWAYTAKWICNVAGPNGFVPSNAESIGLVPGEYKTDINIHNPSFSTTFLNIKKKFVQSVPEAPGVNTTFTPIRTTFLGPDAAIFVDCAEIMQVLNIPTGIAAKGFVEVVTNTPNLNVVAEYSSESFTAAIGAFCVPGSSGSLCVSSGISLDVETIPAAPFVP